MLSLSLIFHYATLLTPYMAADDAYYAIIFFCALPLIIEYALFFR